MDRLKSMEIFMHIVQDGSFARAADSLGVSRPMASKYIQYLEESLGVRLLNRTTRTVSPTEAGRGFYKNCEEIFAQIDEAVARAGNLQTQPSGQVSISAPHTLGRYHLTRILAEFQNEYQDISIELTHNDRIVDIIDEGYDLAIRVGRLSDSSLIARKLAPCCTTLCASPKYLELNGTPQTPKDLKTHNCLVYTYSSEARGWTFGRDGKTEEIKVFGNFRSNYGAAIVEAAVAHRGIILEPTFMTAPYLATGELEQILPEWQLMEPNIYAVYPQRRLLPQKVRLLVDYLADSFGPRAPWDTL